MRKLHFSQTTALGLIASLLVVTNVKAEIIRLECSFVGAQNFSLSFEIDTDKNTINGSPGNLQLTTEIIKFNYKLGDTLYTINRATGETTEVSWGNDSTRIIMHYLCKRVEPKSWWQF